MEAGFPVTIVLKPKVKTAGSFNGIEQASGF
jgi:hypothetical protein